MSRILIVGQGPLLEKTVRNFSGQCLRTTCFLEPLLADGHTIRLVTIPIYNANDPTMERAALVRKTIGGFEYQAFTNCDFDFIVPVLEKLARSFQPDAIVGVNTLPSWVACRLRMCVPLWADLFGYEMTEKQGQAARTGDNTSLAQAWSREETIARRADKFSVVSQRHLYALLGEMASVGRLNQHTFEYHFVHHVPTAYHPAFIEPVNPATPRLLRGKMLPEDAFVMLWSGAYNYWLDPAMLFEVIENTMRAEEAVHFVSTGGGIDGYNLDTYAQFEEMVSKSAFRDRYHLLGWVPGEDVPVYYSETDLALSIDEYNNETVFGARNRINNFMASGVPVLTTAGTEIAAELSDNGVGIVCEPGDVDALVEGAVRMVRDPRACREMGERARQYALEHFDPGTLIAGLREWVHEPGLAPDNLDKLRRFDGLVHFPESPGNEVEVAASVVSEYGVEALLQARDELAEIRSWPWYRSLKNVKDRLRAWVPGLEG